jgi:hypothetical protein
LAAKFAWNLTGIGGGKGGGVGKLVFWKNAKINDKEISNSDVFTIKLKSRLLAIQ